MIQEVIPIVAGELRDFLDMKFDVPDEIVTLGNIVNQDGSMNILEDSKVIVTLVNIERDGTNMLPGGGYGKGDIPVHINLYVLFSAFHSDYAEALKLISGVIGFFQAHTNFIVDGNTIKAELQNLDFREQSNVWSALGAKYLPSVVYRFRTISMDEGNIHDEIPPISGITI